jgi:hypothetical protein
VNSQVQELIGAAELTQKLNNHGKSDPTIAANWALVGQWHPEVRYDIIDNYSAQLMLKAVHDATSGVFPWVTRYW